jgi:hypothetical protein
MIAELLIALQLLRGAEFASVSPKTTATPTPAKTPTPSLAGDLGFVGEITTITQPVVGVGLTPKEASRAYLEAATGIKEQIGTGGRF